VLGRWCEPAAPPGRRFAPLLCERAALVAALRAENPKDPTADALERWERAATSLAGDGGVVALTADWADTARPGERELRVTGPTEATLVAAGIPPTPGRAADGTLLWKLPLRVVAPVLALPDGAELRLPAPPFGR